MAWCPLKGSRSYLSAIKAQREFEPITRQLDSAWYYVPYLAEHVVESPERLLEFIHLPSYVRSVRGRLGDEEQREIELAICRHPRGGAVVPGTGGVRKLRIRIGGHGKSGGGRIVYFHLAAAGRVFLLLFYPKSVQVELTSDQRRLMRQLTAHIGREA